MAETIFFRVLVTVGTITGLAIILTSITQLANLMM